MTHIRRCGSRSALALTLLAVVTAMGTLGGQALAAPPARVIEMVSPLDKNGGVVTDAEDGIMNPPEVDVARDGNRVLYRLSPAATDGTPSNLGITNYYIAQREADAWRSTSVNPPLPPGTGPAPSTTGTPQPFAWAPDLTSLAFNTSWALDLDHDQDRPFQDLDIYLWAPDGASKLLSCPLGEICNAQMSAGGQGSISAGGKGVATNDLAHVVFESPEPLVAPDPPAPPTSGRQVYDRVGDELRLVSQGTPRFGGDALDPTSQIASTSGTGMRPGAISSDGSRIFFVSGGRLYVRMNAADTIEVSRSASNPVPSPSASFLGATRDGNTAFFSATAALTPDDTNAVADLYVWHYDEASDTDSLRRVATLTQEGAPGDPPVNNPNARLLNLVAVSSDPSGPLRIYFVTRTTAAAPDPERVDLYLATNPASSSGAVRFVATVSPTASTAASNDRQCLASSSGIKQIEQTCGRATPNGRFLAFDSRMPLTPDDHDTDGAGTECAPAGPTIPPQCRYDTFLYDAETSTLTRASTGSDGAPASVGNGDFDSRLGVQGFTVRPSMTEDGAVFFQTSEALDPEDVNVVQDVYEFRDGEVALVSGGKADTNQPTWYFGNSADGRDVFFATASQLHRLDTDTASDIYDARVGGGFPEPPPGCDVLGDGCQGSGATALSPPVQSGQAGNGNAPTTRRSVLFVSRPDRAAIRRAVRTGRLRLPVRLNAAGVVRAVARGRVGRRMRRLGSGSVKMAAPGRRTLIIRLDKTARRRLHGGSTLVTTIRTTTTGARARTVRVVLRGGSR